MHIDVHRLRRQVHVEHGGGVAALDDEGVVGLAQALVDGLGLGGPAVDEAALVAPSGPGHAGAGDEPGDGDSGLVVINGDHAVVDVAAEEHADAGGGVSAGVCLEDRLVVEAQLEGHGGVGQRLHQHRLLDVRVLGGGLAEELAAGGEVEEEVADADVGAGCAAAVADVPQLAAFDEDLGAAEVVGAAGLELEMADGGDAGEGLAAEAEGVDAVDVEGGLDLAGGVGFDAEEGVVAVHAAAVVADLDEAAASLLDADGDAGGAGVDRVLDEFLDDGGGAFDDFAGRDAVGGFRWEDVDEAHGGTIARLSAGSSGCGEASARRPAARGARVTRRNRRWWTRGGRGRC
ncbi:MAG: hypothetical protein BWZ02_01315 [Lentisphaerae bacterium ADurb.BinA184]|nr:MAG: hypothetical protein BWZ02_01315 [Lentisphaerae bacterium ADurb.BinA184]